MTVRNRETETIAASAAYLDRRDPPESPGREGQRGLPEEKCWG